MSNSRKYRRSLEATPGNKRRESRDLTEEDIQAMTLEWAELTDELIGTMGTAGKETARPDLDEWLEERLEHISALYGGGALTAGAVGSCTALSSHILVHEPLVGEVGEAIEAAPWMEPPGQRAAAERLATAILAAAAGIPGADLQCLGELRDEMGAGALAVAIGVWMVFCTLGAEVGVGLAFCGDDDDPDLGLGGLDFDTPLDLDSLNAIGEHGEDLEMILELAPDASGLAAGLIAAVRSGDETTALALARSVSAFGAEEETAACLGLLGAHDESGPSLTIAASEAVEVVQHAIEDEDEDEDEDDEVIGAALRSLAERAAAAAPERSTREVVAEIDRRIGLIRAVSR